MIGTRKYVDERGQLLLGEGEYGQDSNGVWFCRPPGNHTGCLEHHDVTEHDDGSITVSPSILIEGEPRWHGYLVAGKWAEVR